LSLLFNDTNDPRCLERYRDRKARWQHASEIRQAYRYREFADPGAQWRLLRWLYALCWTGTDRPSVLFDQATAWLVTHKVLLPGASVLERTIARVRSRTNSRLWRLLAARIKPDQKARLDAVLVVPEGGRQSPMDRLRSGPTLQSTAELARAIERLDDVRQLAAGLPRTARLPKTRVLALARFADAAKAQAVARLPDERRGATLLAFIRALEASAQDDVLDLFDLLVTRMFVDAVRKGREARLRSLRDLDAAALTLSKACALVLNVAVNDGDLRAVVFAVVPQTALEAAVAQVDSLTRPPDDPYFDELLAQHRRIRRFLPRLVRTVGFGAMPAGQPVLKALQYLRKVEEGGVRGKTWPTEFVPKSWERRVIRNGIVDRHAWTLCLVDRLRGALRRRDVFAASSLRFGDPRIGLRDGAAWEAARPTVCRTLAKSQNAAEEIGRLSNRLDHAFRSVAGNLPKNASVRIEQNGIDLARRWGGGDVASADGLRFIVPVRTIHAGPNPKYFGPERGVTYYNLVCDQFAGLNAITAPGTLRDSLVLLSVVLEQETEFEPTEIMTDTGAYTDVIFGIFWLLGYQFSPRIADVGGARFWRVDSTADYGALDKLASHKVKTRIVAEHWDDLLRLAGSLKLGLVQVGGLMRTLQTNERPTRLARTLEELGRIIKTLYLLAYIDNEAYRRRILN
jgi:TnpA family transposase